MKRSEIQDYYGYSSYKSKYRQMFEIIPGYMSFGFPPSKLLIRVIK